MTVHHDVEQHRFVVSIGQSEAELIYSYFSDNILNVEHTAVPPEGRGQGIADALIRAALAFARENGLGVIATCPFTQRWLAAHPDERPAPIA